MTLQSILAALQRRHRLIDRCASVLLCVALAAAVTSGVAYYLVLADGVPMPTHDNDVEWVLRGEVFYVREEYAQVSRWLGLATAFVFAPAFVAVLLSIISKPQR